MQRYLMHLAKTATVLAIIAIGFLSAPSESANAMIADIDKIVPTPQQVSYTDEFLTLHDGTSYKAAIVIGREASPAEEEGADLLQRVLARKNGQQIPILYDDQSNSAYSVVIAIGTKNTNTVNGSHSIDVPDHKEGYAIERALAANRHIVLVTGYEAIGAYYGSTSLAQMIDSSGALTRLRVISVRDYPDMDMRIIKDINTQFHVNNEGEFSYSDARDWMHMLPLLKINVFSLCYSHLLENGWKSPTLEYLSTVKELSNYERDKGIIQFMQEVNPGYSGGMPTDEEFTTLLDLFKLSLDEGASKIMLAFDDQAYSDPAKHRDLANKLQKSLSGQEGFYLLATPEKYNLTESTIGTYLNTFTSGLLPEIGAVWTGYDVFSTALTPAHVSTWRNYTSNPYKIPFYWHNDYELLDTRLNFSDPDVPKWEIDNYYFTDQRVPFKTKTKVPPAQSLTLPGGYVWNDMPRNTSEGVIENIFRPTTPHKIYAISMANWMWNPDAYMNDATEFARAKKYWDTIVSNPGFKQTATASSQFSAAYAPDKAVDGINSNDSVENTWATASGAALHSSWWKLDLGKKQKMEGVRVKYRELAKKAYMVPSSVTVQISNDNVNWTTVVNQSTNVPQENSTYASEVYLYPFQGEARYVQLKFPTGGQSTLIELSEVEIAQEKAVTASTNLAIGKTASASSQYDGTYAAGKANDGLNSHGTDNPDNAWSSASGTSLNSWWKVDLGQQETFKTIEVKFREHIANAAYMVPKTITIQTSNDNTNWTTLIARSANVPTNGQPYASSAYSYSINGQGRYVRLLFEDGGQDTLVQLSEVGIYNRSLPQHQRQTLNAAFKRKATASSEYSTMYPASKANDGTNSRRTAENAWASSAAGAVNSWWEVDLGAQTSIQDVALYFREYPYGIAYTVPSNITFEVSNDKVTWTNVKSATNVPAEGLSYDSSKYTYTLNASGRYLRLKFPGGGQSSLVELSEVEVRSPMLVRSDFHNVISQDGADPWMYKHTDGYYYYTRTTGNNVTIWRSKTLSGIESGEKKVVWTPPTNNPNAANCRSIWAPEIHFLSNAWYVYYSATTCADTKDVNHRMFVLENTSADPFQGTFTDKGKITDSTDLWAIDGTVLNLAGQLYWFWSGWDSPYQNRQNIYVASMSNPYTLSSARTLISSPTLSWEMSQFPYINEAPQPIVKDNKVNLVYSADGSWSNNYNLGLLTASTTSNLLSAASWTKNNASVFSSGSGIFGPGHNSFTKSPDGTEDWLIYHAARWSGAGWTRNVRAQPFTWNADNTPNLSVPVSPNFPIRAPSGEPERKRYEAEEATIANGAKRVQDETASGRKKVGYIDNTNSYVEFDVTVESAGTYILLARTANGTNGSLSSAYNMSVNGGASQVVDIVYSGWGNWGTTVVEKTLTAGHNKIRFTKGANYAEIDYLDIMLKPQ
ncbi:family 43 glycosylhydrolase [Paenibacillus mendelii]|uniref:Family 43 glycosylhydrolase n=1 Tax=Paenibacillus mendelii TaxID=206163 RepID=A0ABV6JD63_9BACL|nr:family 43 glycosylhydrolase [Paenibacillus mendelii]MCQ6562402.1 family 43 glycosylhydrolase [Paenibacillus mendelii]